MNRILLMFGGQKGAKKSEEMEGKTAVLLNSFSLPGRVPI